MYVSLSDIATERSLADEREEVFESSPDERCINSSDFSFCCLLVLVACQFWLAWSSSPAVSCLLKSIEL